MNTKCFALAQGYPPGRGNKLHFLCIFTCLFDIWYVFLLSHSDMLSLHFHGMFYLRAETAFLAYIYGSYGGRTADGQRTDDGQTFPRTAIGRQMDGGRTADRRWIPCMD